MMVVVVVVWYYRHDGMRRTTPTFWNGRCCLFVHRRPALHNIRGHRRSGPCGLPRPVDVGLGIRSMCAARNATFNNPLLCFVMG